MANYPKVTPAKITSLDINSLSAGLDQRGAANIKANSFSVGKNVMVTSQGLATHRFGRKKWLPDISGGTAGMVFPALYNGVVKYITADSGKIKYCVDDDTAWTNCGGDNTVTTTSPVTFIRCLNKVLILNGIDNLGYVDLTTMNVVHSATVASPTSAPTGTLTGITTGSFKVYYCIAYNALFGKTASTPILTQSVSKIREQWASDGSQGVTITDPNTRPIGASSWNLYMATAPAGGTIQYTDLLPIALGLDINTTTYFDNGTVTPITNNGTAPSTNTTQGPKAKYGVEIEGRPFLYGITGDEYAVMIGGDNDNALDFTEGNGGYRLVLNSGTNYYPQSIFGFRNGQGSPSITVLFSNTEGLSKQSIIEQNTVTLGDYSATVWGNTEQNYGSAGVSSPYAVVPYKGAVIFPTVDRIIKINTQASMQNVLLPEIISDPIESEISGIRSDLLGKIVGTAWGNKFMFAAPTGGFTSNNKILIYDVSRTDAECWYTFDLVANWIGTITPPNGTGFVYITEGTSFYKLDTVYVAQDETSTGLTVPFPVELTTALVGSNTAHDGYFAVVQVVFYLRSFIGSVDLMVKYRDYQSGKLKTKTKTVTNGAYTKSSIGNWSSPDYLYNQSLPTKVLRWGDTGMVTDAQSSQKDDMRFSVPLSVVTNELQATVAINLDNSAVVLRSISFQGQSLGISPDIK